MTGYHGYSKSNAAYDAETDGLTTATALAKIFRCTSAAIKKHLSPAIWHHTSKYYNRTDFYDESALVAMATGRENEIDPGDIAETQQLLATLREKLAGEIKTWADCKIEWLEWSGSRNHPHAEKCEAEGVLITRKPGAVTIVCTMRNGSTMRKGVATRGFAAYQNDRRIFF